MKSILITLIISLLPLCGFTKNIHCTDTVVLDYFNTVLFCGQKHLTVLPEKTTASFKETLIYKHLSVLRGLDEANGIDLKNVYAEFQKSIMAQLQGNVPPGQIVTYSQYMTALSALMLQNCDKRLRY